MTRPNVSHCDKKDCHVSKVSQSIHGRAANNPISTFAVHDAPRLQLDPAFAHAQKSG
jgi:hypothetical protein